MKKFYIFTLLLLYAYFVNAQTWTGAGTDWNNPANWNPTTVPTSNDIAVIPGGLGNYPVLSSNITVRSIQMQAGSRLDVNGFSITVISNDITSFTGAILNNSDATTDIVLNIDNKFLGSIAYFRSSTVNDAIIFNLMGGSTFSEGDAGVANQFKGDVTYNITGRLGVNISDGTPSQFSGNLTVNRTTNGETHVFNGGGDIKGNYSFTDNTGSITLMGNNTAKTSIAGTVNITANDPSVSTATSIFEMHRIINQTNGGNIMIQNTAGFLIERDTLKNVAINITGTRGNIIGDILNSSITANTLVSSNVTSLGNSRIYVRNNLFTGNSNFITNGNLIDLYEWGNHFIGNTTFTVNSGTSLHVCYTASSIFDGNVTINRTAAGFTEAFVYGAIINGNFSYTNNTAGDTHLGNFHGFPGRKTTISGTINVTAHFTMPNIFALDEVMNLTGGGNIDVLNSQGANFKNDTLIVNAITITGYKNGRSEFFNNQITGNVTLADDASNSGSFVTDMRNNITIGTSNFTNNGSSDFYDAYHPQYGNYGNKYFGDVSYTRNNGGIYIGIGGSADNVVEYNQNLTLNSASNIFIGKIKFTGSGNSIIEQLGTQPVIVQELAIQKSGSGKVTLNAPVTISGNVTFISGIIYSTVTNSLSFANSASQTGSSSSSYLDGPVTKIGNTAFTFPVGKPGKFAPISISAPLNTTDEFRAQYFTNDPAISGYNPVLKDATLDHLSSSEFWILDRTVGTSNVLVTLSWDANRSGAINNLTDLRVARWNGSLWKDEGNSVVTGTNATGTITTSGEVINFSPFTLASATILNPLPVSLINFIAVNCDGSVCLSWVTENEQNLSGYEIEKSNDGRIYTGFTSLTALNTAVQKTYTAKDIAPFTGNNFYRIKMIEKDGSFKYSAVIKLNVIDISMISILPNPAHNFILLKGINEYHVVKIIDLTGKVKLQQNITSEIKEINTGSLAAGMYMIQLVGNTNTATFKLIKQ